MDNPKYIIIKKNVIGRYDYKYSFACPIVLSKNTETVDLFKSNLKKIIGEMDITYAYNETGRKLYVLCRRKS
ncbi:MAG: hypothetical protein J6U81_04480, partial [Bacteroidales bacterium]|nr:hypothetical protein [Bacteroidales bacterium]